MHKNVEANIEITREDGILSSVSVIMPTWNKAEDSGIMSVTIPLLGLKTFGRNFEDAETATSEAIQCFCLSAEKFGAGIERELELLGWEISDEQGNLTILSYSIESGSFVLEQIMQTGEQFAHELEFA